ncbi:MAG: hypothetical protein WBL88_10020, partial [Nitrososphaeraceae archaeon]
MDVNLIVIGSLINASSFRVPPRRSALHLQLCRFPLVLVCDEIQPIVMAPPAHLQVFFSVGSI